MKKEQSSSKLQKEQSSDKNHENLSDEFRKTFGVPKPEGIIQNYLCTQGTSAGTLFISQNFICFKGSKDPLKIAFARVTNLEMSGMSGFHKIQVTTSDANNNKYVFSVFSWAPFCRHAYNLMKHIWKNPPHYVDVLELRKQAATMDRQHEQQQQQQQQQQRAKVNVDMAKELLKIVSETDEMQNSAMKTLQEQAETIDRIDSKMDDVLDDLKRADHLMKGIESLPYYLFGGSAKKDVKDKREKTLKDRTLKVPENSPPIIEVEILYKTREALTPCVIVLDVDSFKIVDQKTDKAVSHNNYLYIDIEKLLIKARHEYMYILFNTTKKTTIKLCSAYLQILTNQIYTRSCLEGHDVTIEFEVPAYPRLFEYKDEWIYKLPPPKRDGKGKVGGLAGGNFAKLSSLFTNEEQKNDMEQVDQALDQVSGLLSGITDKGRVMNVEIARQTEQLKGTINKVDDASGRMQNLNTRMDKAG